MAAMLMQMQPLGHIPALTMLVVSQSNLMSFIELLYVAEKKNWPIDSFKNVFVCVCICMFQMA